VARPRNKTLPSPIYPAEEEIQSVSRTGDTTMFTKLKIALATALVLGAASAALASNENDGDTGGYRRLGPGGIVTDGVNPVFHPSMRGTAGSAYGYAPAASHKHKTTK
jgi:hypothetical protein